MHFAFLFTLALVHNAFSSDGLHFLHRRDAPLVTVNIPLTVNKDQRYVVGVNMVSVGLCFRKIDAKLPYFICDIASWDHSHHHRTRRNSILFWQATRDTTRLLVHHATIVAMSLRE